MNAYKVLKLALLVGISLLVLTMMGPIDSSQATHPSDGFTAPTCDPKIDISKQEEGPDTRVFLSGADVPYEITVTNTGNVELNNVVVTDSMVTECSHLIGTLAVGEIYSYTCDMPDVTQDFTNIAVVQGDANGDPVNDEDPSTVRIKPSPLYNITVGFEDLEIEYSDFDYNDWVVSIITDLQGVYVDEDTVELEKITFTITPQARGSRLCHEFHIRFEGNTFQSDGVAELIILDSSPHDPITYTLDASVENDIGLDFNETTASKCDYEAFKATGDCGCLHYMRRTVENNGYITPTLRTAVLSIVFNTPFEFDLGNYGQHCQGLFFDPYLYVDGYERYYEISRTLDINATNPETRILCVQDPNWHWPEEGIRINRAYESLGTAGPPFTFVDDWDDYHNTCVFDHMPCLIHEVNSILYLPLMLRSEP